MLPAFSARNLTLAAIPPTGGTTVPFVPPPYSGRKVELQAVQDGGQRYTRALVDGVAFHFDVALADCVVVRLACAHAAGEDSDESPDPAGISTFLQRAPNADGRWGQWGFQLDNGGAAGGGYVSRHAARAAALSIVARRIAGV